MFTPLQRPHTLKRGENMPAEQNLQLLVQLKENFEKQFAFYCEMLAVTRELCNCCAKTAFEQEGTLEKLNELLQKRQEQVEEIKKLQKQGSSLQETMQVDLGLENLDLNTLCRLLPPQEADSLRKAHRQREKLLKEIAALDSECRRALENGRDKLKRSIRSVRKGKQASRAYKPLVKQVEGVFVDNKNKKL